MQLPDVSDCTILSYSAMHQLYVVILHKKLMYCIQINYYHYQNMNSNLGVTFKRLFICLLSALKGVLHLSQNSIFFLLYLEMINTLKNSIHASFSILFKVIKEPK